MHRFTGLLLAFALVLSACDTQIEQTDALSPRVTETETASNKFYDECFDYTFAGQRDIAQVGGGSPYTNYQVDEHLEVGIIGATCGTNNANGQITVRGLGSFISSDSSVLMHHVTVRVYQNGTLIHSYNSGSTVPSQTAGQTTTSLNRTLNLFDEIEVRYSYEIETNNEIYQGSLVKTYVYSALS